jgi:type I site-specific restriction endonuclease
MIYEKYIVKERAEDYIEDLYNKTFSKHDEWKEKFNAVQRGGKYEPRFYQEIAINSVLDAIAEDKNRMLLTLATGTGKTVIAFEIAWKLFYSRWNLSCLYQSSYNKMGCWNIPTTTALFS